MSKKSSKTGSGGITLVVPVFNRLGQIERTLASIAAQSRMPDDIVLVDNGSMDGSWEYLFRWRDEMRGRGIRVRVEREPRPGAARARQTGLEFVETEYVMFFDSDDFMPSGYVANAMRDFEENPELDMTVWGVTSFYEDGRRHRRRVWSDGTLPTMMENHLVQGLLSTQAYAVKTSFLRAAGGWNPKIGGWDDLELGLRLLLARPRLKLSRESKVDVLVQEKSISGIGYSHRAGDWEHTLDTMRAEVPESTPTALKNLIYKLIAYRQINLAAHYRREGLIAESEWLLDKGLAEEALSDSERRVLRIAYEYTRRGLPGAGAIFPRFLR